MEQHTQNEEQNVQTNEASPVKKDGEQTPPHTENSIKEIFKFALIALIIVVPIRFYIAQPFIVQGGSMESTFHSGEYLIVDQLSYRFEEPRRGEVIIFRFPGDTSKFYIKRIIGLPGETVELKDTKVIIKNETLPDGLVLNEPYLDEELLRGSFSVVKLEEDEYFVMGDNRRASSDSRTWGALSKDLIVGKAFVRLFPLQTIDLFPGGHYSY